MTVATLANSFVRGGLTQAFEQSKVAVYLRSPIQSPAPSSSKRQPSIITTPNNPESIVAVLDNRHALECALRAVLVFLRSNGVSKDSIRELQDMVDREQFLEVLHRAQEYVEYGLFAKFNSNNNNNNNNKQQQEQPFDLEAMLHLFVGAWEALTHYVHGQSSNADTRLAQLELQVWKERIEQQDMPRLQRLKRRQQQRLLQYKIQKEMKQLGAEYAKLVQFKRSSTTGLVLIQEWARCTRSKFKRNQLGGQKSKKMIAMESH